PGFAFGFGSHLLLVTFSLLHDARSTSARLWHYLVGVGFRFVAHAVLIGTRGLHVAVGGEDLGRRVDFLHLHPRNRHAGAVGIENLLDQIADFDLDRIAAYGENGLDLVFAHNLTHRAL